MDVIVVGCILFICVILDLKYRKIPNFITVPFLLGGVTYTFLEAGIRGLGVSALNVMIVVMIFAYGFIKGYMGAGDVKLLLALAFWMNLQNMVVFIFATLVTGAIISVCKIVINVKNEQKKQCIEIHQMDPVLLMNRLKKKSGKTIAYAVPIFIGYFFMIFFK